MYENMVLLFKKYMGTGLVIILFMIAWFVLFFREQNKSRRVMFVYLPLLVLIVFFNPLFAGLFYYRLGTEIYFRIMWMIPFTVVIAYALTSCVELIKSSWRVPYIIMCAVLIMISGKLVYDNPLYSVAENRYHVPQYVVDVCDEIRFPGREVMAVMPNEFLLYTRQYDGTICMPYGRDVFNYGTPLSYAMNAEEVDAEKLSTLAREESCHFIILAEDTKFIGDLRDYDYEFKSIVDGYLIFQDSTVSLAY